MISHDIILMSLFFPASCNIFSVSRHPRCDPLARHGLVGVGHLFAAKDLEPKAAALPRRARSQGHARACDRGRCGGRVRFLGDIHRQQQGNRVHFRRFKGDLFDSVDAVDISE